MGFLHGAGAQGLEPPSVAFQVHKQGDGLEVEQLGYNLAPIWDANAVCGGLTMSTTALAPRLCSLLDQPSRLKQHPGQMQAP